MCEYFAKCKVYLSFVLEFVPSKLPMTTTCNLILNEQGFGRIHKIQQ